MLINNNIYKKRSRNHAASVGEIPGFYINRYQYSSIMAAIIPVNINSVTQKGVFFLFSTVSITRVFTSGVNFLYLLKLKTRNN
jgi:hypothetical protein